MRAELAQIQQEKDAAIARARAEAERAEIERQRADDEQEHANEEARRAMAAMSQNMDEEISDNEFENQNSQGDEGNAENTEPPPAATPALGNNYELAQLIKSLGNTVNTINVSMQNSIMNVGKVVGKSIMELIGEPAAKKRKLEEASASEFVHNDRSLKNIPKYTGMSFEGMTSHLKIKPSYIN